MVNYVRHYILLQGVEVTTHKCSKPFFQIQYLKQTTTAGFTSLSLKCTGCSKTLAYTFPGESFFPDAFKGKSKGGKNDPKTPQAADKPPPAKKIKF
jgi:hypothetical protein